MPTLNWIGKEAVIEHIENANDTAIFLARIAGGLSEDFPDDIDESGLIPDALGETKE
jgi:hypothetical protein